MKVFFTTLISDNLSVTHKAFYDKRKALDCVKEHIYNNDPFWKQFNQETLDCTANSYVKELEVE
jgi:hypothetical protein